MLRLSIASIMLCLSSFAVLAQDRYSTPSQDIPFDSMKLEKRDWLKALAFRLPGSIEEQEIRSARFYYFSFLAGFSHRCDLGTLNALRINKAVLEYNVLNLEDTARGGFEILQQIAEMITSGDAAILIEFAMGEGMGRADADAVVDQSGCGDETADLVEAAIRFLELSREDPVADELMNPVVAEIKAAGLAHASFGETCLDRYGDQRFCGCLASGLDSVPLSRVECKRPV